MNKNGLYDQQRPKINLTFTLLYILQCVYTIFLLFFIKMAQETSLGDCQCI